MSTSGSVVNQSSARVELYVCRAHHILEVRFGLRAEVAPVLRCAHRFAIARSVRQLNAIGVSDHVVMEHDAAHAGQLHAASLRRIAARGVETLGARDQLLLQLLFAGIVETPIGPVTVRAKHAGQLSWPPLRTVKVARDKMAGKALQEDLLHGVLTAIDRAVDHGVGGRLGRHGPQARGHQHLATHPLGPLRPRFARRRRRERKTVVEGFQRTQSAVVGELPRGKDPGSFRPHHRGQSEQN